jgi:ubiquinone/menaquinone biosynthesis C-methylase UbiE
MKFDAPTAQGIYGGRSADATWENWCEEYLRPNGRDVVDIGCGGGIYAAAFLKLGARSVTGIDKTQQYVDEAIARCGQGKITFRRAKATQTGLPDRFADIVFERALVHHLMESERIANAAESLRILRPGGILCVQDRTFENTQDKGPEFWMRTTLFEEFPRLVDFESHRRPDAQAYMDVLRANGFSDVRTCLLSETRKRYQSFDELRAEILSRKGKSILFELSDKELVHYCELLEAKSKTRPLVETDKWTIWLASKPQTAS